MFPDEGAIGSLIGAILLEANDEWQLQHRYMQIEAMAELAPETISAKPTQIATAAKCSMTISATLKFQNMDGHDRGAVNELPANIKSRLAHTFSSAISVRYMTLLSVPHVMADRGQLEPALLNLGTNARDARPGGGTVTCSLKPQQVAICDRHAAGLAPADYIQLSVFDTGTGMGLASLARAAEPFFTTKPAVKGTGLGLPMVESVAERCGGRMLITSSLGAGTTMTMQKMLAITSIRMLLANR